VGVSMLVVAVGVPWSPMSRDSAVLPTEEEDELVG